MASTLVGDLRTAQCPYCADRMHYTSGFEGLLTCPGCKKTFPLHGETEKQKGENIDHIRRLAEEAAATVVHEDARERMRLDWETLGLFTAVFLTVFIPFTFAFGYQRINELERHRTEALTIQYQQQQARLTGLENRCREYEQQELERQGAGWLRWRHRSP